MINMWEICDKGERIFIKNRLIELRKQNMIKQQHLADEMGVSRQTISSLEHERYNPSIELAFKLGKFFKCSIADIFLYEEDKDNNCK